MKTHTEYCKQYGDDWATETLRDHLLETHNQDSGYLGHMFAIKRAKKMGDLINHLYYDDGLNNDMSMLIDVLEEAMSATGPS